MIVKAVVALVCPEFMIVLFFFFFLELGFIYFFFNTEWPACHRLFFFFTKTEFIFLPHWMDCLTSLVFSNDWTSLHFFFSQLDVDCAGGIPQNSAHVFTLPNKVIMIVHGAGLLFPEFIIHVFCYFFYLLTIAFHFSLVLHELLATVFLYRVITHLFSLTGLV